LKKAVPFVGTAFSMFKRIYGADNNNIVLFLDKTPVDLYNKIC
jgi:hypothetical protein